MRTDFFRPLPVKSEAVSTGELQIGSSTVVLLDAATLDDLPVIIDESERLLSADELYREALEGSEPDRHKPRSRPTSVPQPRMQLWGSGTSGMPRRGSRTIRLFRADPDQVAKGVRHTALTDQLTLGRYESRMVMGEPELHGSGHLYGAFLLRPSAPVDVTIRVARFNGTFAALELKLASRGHPRHFFRAAHDAVEALDLPGR